jgi:hypothetical protein
MRKILLFLLSVTALSGLGCGQNTTTTNKPAFNTTSEKITTETNETAVPTHTVFSIKNLSVRIPVTFSYSSENLSYGRILTSFTNQKDRLTILVEPLSDAPTKNTAEGDEEIRSKTELRKNQGKIISYTNNTSSSKIPFISTRYDVSEDLFINKRNGPTTTIYIHSVFHFHYIPEQNRRTLIFKKILRY